MKPLKTESSTPNPLMGRRATTATLIAAALLSTVPSAHLSIIRQGRESAGQQEAGDDFGRVLCSGDFNGDGYDDLATAAPYEDVPGLTGSNHGTVIISWGSELGLTHVGARVIAPGSWLDQSGPLFGRALACADFDSDGYDDLVVGAHGHDGETVGGRAYVYNGPALTSDCPHESP